MPNAEEQTNNPDNGNGRGSSMYGCPLFIVAFIVLLIVLALFFL